jgi:hypothetical protein
MAAVFAFSSSGALTRGSPIFLTDPLPTTPLYATMTITNNLTKEVYHDRLRKAVPRSLVPIPPRLDIRGFLYDTLSIAMGGVGCRRA